MVYGEIVDRSQEGVNYCVAVSPVTSPDLFVWQVVVGNLLATQCSQFVFRPNGFC